MERSIRVQAELPFINKHLKWKVTSIFKNVDLKAPTPIQHNVRTWTPDSGDSDFVLIRPNIGISINIYSYNPYGECGYVQSVYMSYDRIILFQRELERVVIGFYEIENLFYLKQDKTGLNTLHVDAELASKYERVFPTSGKTIKMKYVTVPDEEDQMSSYEGIAFFINTYDIYVTLTKVEVERMLYTLQHTDFMNLSLQLLAAVPIFKNK